MITNELERSAADCGAAQTRIALQGMDASPARRLDHLTFKGNLKNTRYGWLRLTPAYSVHLVAEILDRATTAGGVVLDPFCGTGTTALVCAERGIRCDTTDINPFLLWLTRTKTTSYSRLHLAAVRNQSRLVYDAIRKTNGVSGWEPPLHQIEKWWTGATLRALGRGMSVIHQLEKTKPPEVVDLLKIAFCRTMIDCAHVSFGHQSMSFKKKDAGTLLLPMDSEHEDLLAMTWSKTVDSIVTSATSEIAQIPSPIYCDARDLRTALTHNKYDLVVTSPPYPNRMSYIRELRPYMYWLGYLSDGRQAGELDWQAIGGTWGCATSNVGKWRPETTEAVPYDDFNKIIRAISERSEVLGRYVEKYFHDMVAHCKSLFAVVVAGGSVHYIVGNSKFYEVMLPVEAIYAALFHAVGFENVKIDTIRKRTSKKELFEFVVSARKPLRP